MLLIEVNKVANAEAHGRLEAIDHWFEAQALDAATRIEKAQLDLAHGAGESYDNPFDTNRVLNARLFNLFNGLWQHKDGSEAVMSPVISVSTGPDTDWNAHALRTFEAPAISQTLVLERVEERPGTENSTASYGLRTLLGSVGIVGWDSDEGPRVREHPWTERITNLEDIVGYQMDIDTMSNIYRAIGMNPQLVMHEEQPVSQAA